MLKSSYSHQLLYVAVECSKDSELLGILKKKLENVHLPEDAQGIYEIVINNGETIHIILNAGE